MSRGDATPCGVGEQDGDQCDDDRAAPGLRVDSGRCARCPREFEKRRQEAEQEASRRRRKAQADGSYVAKVTTKVCPSCGNSALAEMGTCALKFCPDCDTWIPWFLEPGQKLKYC